MSLQPNKTATVELELDTEATKQQDSADITNLTAEIESFVRIADTDEGMLKTKIIEDETAQKANMSLRQSLERNDSYPQNSHTEEITIESIQNLGEMDENSKCNTSPIKILIRAPTEEEPILNIDEESKISTTIEQNSNDAENEVLEFVQKSMEPNEETKVVPTSVAPKELKIQDQHKVILPTLPEEFIVENDANKDVTSLEVNELKITESSDDLTILSDETKHEVCEIRKEPCSSNEIPLRINKNDGKKNPPTPPLRRRSVKEIIESINKCQSLLKVNQDLTKVNNTDLFQTSSKSFFIDRNMNETNKKDYQNKRLFTDMTEVNANIPLFVEKFNELNNNNHNSNALFEKCVVQNDEKETNVGSRWNPVPKPRRRGAVSFY